MKKPLRDRNELILLAYRPPESRLAGAYLVIQIL